MAVGKRASSGSMLLLLSLIIIGLASAVAADRDYPSVVVGDASNTTSSAGAADHKDLYPLNERDIATIVLATIGLLVAAGGE